MIKNFMFSYSVKVKKETDRHEKAAQAVRAKIATISNIDWTKLKDVETTMKGLITLSGETLEARRSCAERLVKKELAAVLNEVEHDYQPHVHVALSVDTLGDVIAFEVK